jgi:hypothetical protein
LALAVSICASLCALGLWAAPAPAAAPEVPETLGPAGSLTGNTAVSEGVLNPHASAKVSWHFAYSNPNGSSCQEGPTVGGGEADGEAVHVSTRASGLQPLRTYVFCLVASNEAGEARAGNEVAFSTPAIAPAVDSETVNAITPFAAVLEGQVNPENQETTFKIDYATKQSSGELQEATGFAFGGVPANVFGDQRVGTVTYEAKLFEGESRLEAEPGPITGLSPATRYFFRVVAQNPTGETKGHIEDFETLPAEKPTVEDVHLVAASIESDTVGAQLNPKYQSVSCEVQYVSEAVFEATGFSQNVSSTGCTPVAPVTAFSGGSPVAFTATLGGLREGTAYEYRVVARNGTGTVETAPALLTRTVPVVLETLPGPEVSEVTQHTATVTATINPEIEAPIEATYYVVYGPEKAQGQASAHQGAGSGLSKETLAPVVLPGLQPSTTYRYAVVVSNPNGATIGPEHQFTTLAAPSPTGAPSIAAQRAQFVNEDSTVIEAEIDPHGQPTTYQVQYGTSTAYGSVAPAPAAELAAFTSTHGVLVGLNGLGPGTIYHYRIIASNATGASYGPDQTFTTIGAAQTRTFTPFSVASAPQVASAPFTFPREAAGGNHGGTITARSLTRKQKLARALKACRRETSNAKRAKCAKQARKRYGPAKESKSGGRRG